MDIIMGRGDEITIKANGKPYTTYFVSCDKDRKITIETHKL